MDACAEKVEERVLAALRHTTPLTCGQVVASELLRAVLAGVDSLAVRDLDAALASQCGESLASGRPLDRPLLEEASRRDRLSNALGWCADAGLVARLDPRTVRLLPEAIVANPVLARSATEHASARALTSDLAPGAAAGGSPRPRAPRS